jgi:hypothetical protein
MRRQCLDRRRHESLERGGAGLGLRRSTRPTRRGCHSRGVQLGALSVTDGEQRGSIHVAFDDTIRTSVRLPPAWVRGVADGLVLLGQIRAVY